MHLACADDDHLRPSTSSQLEKAISPTIDAVEAMPSRVVGLSPTSVIPPARRRSSPDSENVVLKLRKSIRPNQLSFPQSSLQLAFLHLLDQLSPLLLPRRSPTQRRSRRRTPIFRERSALQERTSRLERLLRPTFLRPSPPSPPSLRLLRRVQRNHLEQLSNRSSISFVDARQLGKSPRYDRRSVVISSRRGRRFGVRWDTISSPTRRLRKRWGW